jgi:hypothetical protein
VRVRVGLRQVVDVMIEIRTDAPHGPCIGINCFGLKAFELKVFKMGLIVLVELLSLLYNLVI